MTAIWHKDGDDWGLLQPVGFPDEATLHTLIADAPHLLPLSGSPRLVIVGREVRIGSGFADLVAIEPDGRVAIIEVKLARNAEARRAVVAQILTYAAYLRGSTRQAFEQEILGSHLQHLGHASLASAITAGDETGSIEPEAFLSGLEESLTSGAFRLVLVLDEAPPELVRLVGYLEAIGEDLEIDLVTVSRYEVEGNPVLVPQRVDPSRSDVSPPGSRPASALKAVEYFAADSGAEFEKGIDKAPVERQELLAKLLSWARSLESEGLTRLQSYHGKTYTLLMRVPGEEGGLATVWGDGYLALWRSVFERRAAGAINVVETLLSKPLGQPTFVRPASDDLLAAIADAYRTALQVSTKSVSAVSVSDG